MIPVLTKALQEQQHQLTDKDEEIKDHADDQNRRERN